MKISQVWRTIAAQLAKENKKFIYSVIRKGARAKEFEEAIQWLSEANLIYKICNISTPKIPLDAYANFDFFKLYAVDVGLLGAQAKLPAKSILYGDQLFQEFRGALTENYVTQELIRCGYDLYYWTSEGRAELDFVIQQENQVYPIEVKSGNTGRKKSLRVYQEKYKSTLSLRFGPRNLQRAASIINCPLYLIEQCMKLLK